MVAALTLGIVTWRLIAVELLPHTPVPLRATVVVVRDSEASDAFEPRAEVVKAMLDRAVMDLVGKTNVAAAWATLVSTQDVVGIKVYSLPGDMAGTRPAVVSAAIHGLLAMGIPPRNIVVWDRRLADLRAAGFGALAARYGVRLAGSLDVGYDHGVLYDSPLLGTLMSGDLEFGQGEDILARKSYVTKLVTRDLTKIINIVPVLNHYDAGVVGNLYSLSMGSLDNVRRFESRPAALARAVPEIYALPALGDRVVLNVTDALICQFEGGETVRLHNAAVLNEIRVSQDPVALDVLAIRDLTTQRQLAGFAAANTNYMELYQNAALLELGVTDVSNIEIRTAR